MVESDFFPDEYEMADIERLIIHQGIEPIRSENGYIDVPKDDVVVYLADKGEVDYAVAFEKYKVKQNGYEMEM